MSSAPEFKTKLYGRTDAQTASWNSLVQQWIPISEVQTFVDGTAFTGGGSVRLASLFSSSTGLAVEMSSETASELQKNITKRGLSDRVQCRHANILEMIRQERVSADLVYLDPNWDWKRSYDRTHPDWEMALVDKPGLPPQSLCDVINSAFRSGLCLKYLLLEVPLNFDINTLKEHWFSECTLEKTGNIYDTRRKRDVMTLVLFRATGENVS